MSIVLKSRQQKLLPNSLKLRKLRTIIKRLIKNARAFKKVLESITESLIATKTATILPIKEMMKLLTKLLT